MPGMRTTPGPTPVSISVAPIARSRSPSSTAPNRRMVRFPSNSSPTASPSRSPPSPTRPTPSRPPPSPSQPPLIASRPRSPSLLSPSLSTNSAAPAACAHRLCVTPSPTWSAPAASSSPTPATASRSAHLERTAGQGLAVKRIASSLSAPRRLAGGAHRAARFLSRPRRPRCQAKIRATVSRTPHPYRSAGSGNGNPSDTVLTRPSDTELTLTQVADRAILKRVTQRSCPSPGPANVFTAAKPEAARLTICGSDARAGRGCHADHSRGGQADHRCGGQADHARPTGCGPPEGVAGGPSRAKRVLPQGIAS
jgi:hypothetical protein